jgi:hypothetical protein
VLDARDESQAFVCGDSYRTWDLHEICFGEDDYNIWVASADIGIYCYFHINGKWIKKSLEIAKTENEMYVFYLENSETGQENTSDISITANQIPEGILKVLRRWELIE